MDISYSKTEAFGFLKEKVHKKLQGWREKTLSIAGKEVLLKTVVQSIPTYVMSCFELPKQLCLDIQQCMARFWWGAKGDERKIHWIAWEKLCAPKTEGGLGYRNLNLFNQALLAKQGWRLLTNPSSVAARVLKARYFPHSSFMEAVCQPGMSFSWRSILAGKTVLARGLRYQIGNGCDVSIWDDPWLPLPYNFKPFSPPKANTEHWKVKELMNQDSLDWNKNVVEDLFTKMEADIILSIPLSLCNKKDRLIWHYDARGIFNVKSGYHAAWNYHNQQSSAAASTSDTMVKGNIWNKIWKAHIPPKVRSFVWRLIKGILPTRYALSKKVSIQDMKCLFCNDQVESDTHLFKHCSVLVSYWKTGSFGKLFELHPTNCLADWILDVADNFNNELFDKFLTCLWVIWKERNNILWNNGGFCPTYMASWAS